MLGDPYDDVGVALDLEIEAVATADASLPLIKPLVVLLGAEGRVAEVFSQQGELFVCSFLYLWRKGAIVGDSVWSKGALMEFSGCRDKPVILRR